MSYPTTVNNLPANRVLVVTADALSSGTVTWQDTGVTEALITLGKVQRYGPFEEPRQYTLTHITGTLIDTRESTVYESGIVGLQCNLTTVPAGENLTIPAGSQCLIHGTMTLNGTLDLDGSLVLL
jgi:hypothetical protein